ncbi:unnamed protein product [Lactuca saligna]|uniref:CASP-like protein n=1 Tax=Lactuca saligna TaxID=75948 RepID=A0AA35ZPQ9_LACSI|nr:unnamed protein product [Lactuca saligna]
MARPDQQPQSQSDDPHAQTQIQLSESYQTEDHSQVEIVNHSESQVTNQTPISSVQVLAIVSLTIRVATWICLLASLIVLASDTSTIKGLYRNVKIGFNDIYSYRYMMSAIVIGFTYTCVQLPIEIYQVSMGKRVMIGNGLPMIIFFGDKFLLSMLATGVGAAFGATFDLKKNLDDLDDYLESIGEPLFSQLRTKLDNFFNMAYVSSGLLLIAFLCSIASSILSSFSFQKK